MLLADTGDRAVWPVPKTGGIRQPTLPVRVQKDYGGGVQVVNAAFLPTPPGNSVGNPDSTQTIRLP